MLLVAGLVEVLVVLIYLLKAHYFLYSVLGLVYFVFWYLSDAPATGNDAKPSLRRWVKCSAVDLIWPEQQAALFRHGRVLFLLPEPQATYMALISGFGFYGRAATTLDQLNVRYVLPPMYFRVPLIRELLLWSGAVGPTRDSNDAEESLIIDLLRHGKSVAWASRSGMSKSVLEFASRNQVVLVIVMVSGESKQYYISHNRACFPRIFGQEPPPKTRIKIMYPTDLGHDNRLPVDELHGILERQLAAAREDDNV
jgi:hypothetical protein